MVFDNTKKKLNATFDHNYFVIVLTIFIFYTMCFQFVNMNENSKLRQNKVQEYASRKFWSGESISQKSMYLH